MNNVWFCSDLHLGHENILEYTRRNEVFTGLGEHDQVVTETFNQTVQPNDDVFFVGDLALHKSKWQRAEAIEKLNGRKHLAVGNHDREFTKFYRESGLFAEVDTVLELKYNKKFIVMSHYPMVHWLMGDKGSWMLHGHLHGDFDYAGFNLQKYRMLDVGYDSLAALRMTDWDGTPPREHAPGLYRPIKFEDIALYFEKTGKVSMPKRHANGAD